MRIMLIICFFSAAFITQAQNSYIKVLDISKTDESEKTYNKGIRGHWGIENRLHWVKDVVLNEDKSMVSDLDRSVNMSIIRNIVINLYRMSGYQSVKYAIEEFTNKIEKCTNLIYNNLVYE